MPTVGHFKSIDGLRAWMAWWVVLQHILQLSGMKEFIPPILYRIMTSGGIAVNVFIIVSGYVICHLLLSEREGYKVYILRRFLRVYPLYLFALLLSISIQSMYLDAFTAYTWIEGVQHRTDRALHESEYFWSYFILHLSLFHGVFPDSILPYSSTAFLAPAWSLSLEWQFYLVAPLIMLIFTQQRYKFPFISILITLLIAIFCVYFVGWKWDIPSNLFLSLGYFLIGMATRYVLQGNISHILPAIGLAVVNFSLAIYVYGYNFLIELALALAIWAVAMFAAQLEARQGKTKKSIFVYIFQSVFSGKVIAEIGKWSYSTYLLHIPILSIVIFLVGCTSIDGRYSYVVAMFVSVPCILYISKLSYIWLEKPAIVYGKKIVNKNNKATAI